MGDLNSHSNKGQWLVTVLILTGLFTAYLAQFQPAPVLTLIMDDLMVDMSQAGLGISIIFPVTIVFSLIGGYLLQSLGIRKLYILVLLITGVGVLGNYFAVNYAIFLAGRIVYGIGFGLSIPFLGAAIMAWYKPKQREYMNTAMAIFPFITNFVLYGFTMPIYGALGNSWGAALGVWGILTIVVLIVWVIFSKNHVFPQESGEEEGQKEDHLYGKLIKRKEVLILCITFICDFASYAFIVGILPTFYQVEAGLSIEKANSLASIFPFAGIIAVIIAGVIMSASGRRKPMLVLGQLFKFVGFVLVVIGVDSTLGLVGSALIGAGTAMWIPSNYMIPMELEDMNPTRVGGAFALQFTAAFIAGTLAPVIGGWLSELITIKYALLVFGMPNLISFIATMMIRETGPAARRKAI